MTPTDPSPAVRRRPAQRRSQERVDRILDAARDLLADGGYEALTMKDLAARADVAIGTVYQFFSGKQQVVATLGERYLDAAGTVVEGVRSRRFRSWERALDAVFDAYVAFYREEPAFRALWVDQHLDASLRDADAVMNARIAQAARSIVEPLLPGRLPDAERSFRIAIEVGDHLLDVAFRTDPDGDPATIAAARRLIRLHLRDELGLLPRR